MTYGVLIHKRRSIIVVPIEDYGVMTYGAYGVLRAVSAGASASNPRGIEGQNVTAVTVPLEPATYPLSDKATSVTPETGTTIELA